MVFTKVNIPNEYTKFPIKNKRLMGIRIFSFSLAFLEEIGKVSAALVKTKELKCLSLKKGLLESEEDSITHTLQRSERTSFSKIKIKSDKTPFLWRP